MLIQSTGNQVSADSRASVRLGLPAAGRPPRRVNLRRLEGGKDLNPPLPTGGRESLLVLGA